MDNKEVNFTSGKNGSSSMHCTDWKMLSVIMYWLSYRTSVYIIVEVIYCIGFVGNLLSLIVFYVNAKFHSACYNQLSIILCDTLATVSGFAVTASGLFNIWENRGPEFVHSNFMLLFLLASFANTMHTCSAIALVILLLGSAYNSLYCLFRPVECSNINDKRRKLVALKLFVLSYFVGILVSSGLFHTIHIEPDEKLGYAVIFVSQNTVFGIFTDVMEKFLFLGGFVLLIVLSIILIVKYSCIKAERNVQKEEQPFITDQTSSEPFDDNDLLLLLYGQLFLCILGMCALNTHTSLLAFDIVHWCDPLAFVLGYVKCVLVALQFSSNFFVYWGLSPSFRRAVKNVFQL